MLILAIKPGHDGSIAVIEDRTLLFSLESEKDSFPRFTALTPSTLLEIAERLPEPPDVVGLGGWYKHPEALGSPIVGAGYLGPHVQTKRMVDFFGRSTAVFASTHERSHIMMAAGLAQKNASPQHAVLVYEGSLGDFYLLSEGWEIKRQIPVMVSPGSRYAFVFALADPTFPDGGVAGQRLSDSGKLMALAGFADPSDADPEVTQTVDRILSDPVPMFKADFRDAPIYNVGVTSDRVKAAAALITERLFQIFASAAQEHLPPDIPLYISGGCGLNCDWNTKWRELGYFSSVFVPPCTNDSGSALGTALDALAATTGDPRIDWSVYSGLEFEWDCDPDPANWKKQQLDNGAIADALARGRIFAWVQGRWEMGPRALGNRSILAEPFEPGTRDRLNEIKLREDYRPVAPCCRIEDAGSVFDDDSEDPYMLYFRKARSNELGAVTHVDGTARVQTVTKEQNEPLHDLLSAFAARRGVGVLCNTSLNFKGLGFINRMSDLAAYCETRGINDFVVANSWFESTQQE